MTLYIQLTLPAKGELGVVPELRVKGVEPANLNVELAHKYAHFVTERPVTIYTPSY